MLKFFGYQILFFLCSCSFLIKKIDPPPVISRSKTGPSIIQSYYPTNEKISFQLVGQDKESQSLFLKIIKENKKSLDFLDKFAIWSLIQFSVRPDLSTPNSRLQVLMKIKGKSHYFDFYSEDGSENQFPFLFGVEWILKKFGKDKTLESYLKILSSSWRKKIKINKEFENFLVTNYDKIKNDTWLSQFYMRGVDILKQNETSPELNYKKVFKLYRQNRKIQKITVKTSLIPFVTENGNSGRCNYDFNLYDNSIYLIDKVIPVSNLYGLADRDSTFLASSSLNLKSITSLHGLPLFEGSSKVRSSAVCLMENNGNTIWAISNQSRDPGQHLFHLVRYGLPGLKSTSEVDKLIRHSRHLFLSGPVRLVIESARSSQEQIQNLLKLNLPVYNAEKLGNIWTYTEFEGTNRFIIDDRNSGNFTCR